MKCFRFIRSLCPLVVVTCSMGFCNGGFAVNKRFHFISLEFCVYFQFRQPSIGSRFSVLTSGSTFLCHVCSNFNRSLHFLSIKEQMVYQKTRKLNGISLISAPQFQNAMYFSLFWISSTYQQHTKTRDIIYWNYFIT